MFYFDTIALFKNCEFEGNSAKTFGGAIATEYSVSSYSSCLFLGNRISEGSGGAIGVNTSSTIILSKCSFIANNSTENGGGVTVLESSATIVQSNFTLNEAATGTCNFFHWLNVVN